jgi:hypothetical protein
VASLVLFVASSREAWSTLESSFSFNNVARSMDIRNKLGEMKKLDMSVEAFFTKVKSMTDTLAAIG